jgi:GNAT superfamily N-acetyltransferase
MAQTMRGETFVEPSAHNLARFFTGFPRRTVRWDDAWAGDSESPEPIINSAALLRPLDGDAARELTERLDRFYGSASGGPWMLWSAWPTPDLAPLGYMLAGRPPLMVRPAGTPPVPLPDGMRIVEARDPAELAVFERALVAGYGLTALEASQPGDLLPPAALGGPARYWIGYAGDAPVTVAAAVAGDGVVGIYAVATMPEARGKGYGGAVTDAAARCDPTLPAVLQASDMGRPVYERIGFTTVAQYTLWLRNRGAR